MATPDRLRLSYTEIFSKGNALRYYDAVVRATRLGILDIEYQVTGKNGDVREKSLGFTTYSRTIGKREVEITVTMKDETSRGVVSSIYEQLRKEDDTPVIGGLRRLKRVMRYRM